MRVISRTKLKDFWQLYSDAEQPLQTWYAEAKHANWARPSDLKDVHRNASIVGNNRVVFNIGGNKYRLVVAVHYNRGIVFIRFVGTHQEYDKIDASTV